ncbi:histidinol-phosphate transaminase [Deferribacterales bacterium RsTz2092]|nr:Thr-phospho decarboxylase [Deferribacterales bacterium]
MTRYEHGGNVWTIARTYGYVPKDIIDLSTCVAHSAPNALKEVLTQDWLLGVLPEPYSPLFSTNYRKKNNLEANFDVLLTAGTTEVIYAISRMFAGKNVSIIPPTYMDYERAAGLAGMNINFDNYDNVKLAFICNPNNPTGELISQEVIVKLVGKYPDTLFVIDESYMPFVFDGWTSVCMARNVITLRSYSKVFGIPGLRIGYVVADMAIIEGIKAQISTWSVSTIAQQAALKLLESDEIPTDKLDATERMRFVELLRALGLAPAPSATHFNLCQVLDGVDAKYLVGTAAKKGVLLRDCSNIRGLESGSFVRVSMRKGWQQALERVAGCIRC